MCRPLTLALVVLALAALATSCMVTPTLRPYLIPGQGYSYGNVQHGGNVHVLILNEGRIRHADISFNIRKADSSTKPGKLVGEGYGLVYKDGHNGMQFSYALPPGRYVFSIDDGVKNELKDKVEAWTEEFTVNKRGKRYITVSYWVVYRGKTGKRDGDGFRFLVPTS